MKYDDLFSRSIVVHRFPDFLDRGDQQAEIECEKSILKNYPKLAICIYHSTKDLWEIPIFINDLFPDYSHFEIRHHTKLFFETVLYVYR